MRILSGLMDGGSERAEGGAKPNGCWKGDWYRCLEVAGTFRLEGKAGVGLKAGWVKGAPKWGMFAMPAD